jgi:hypothetical protein
MLVAAPWALTVHGKVEADACHVRPQPLLTTPIGCIVVHPVLPCMWHSHTIRGVLLTCPGRVTVDHCRSYAPADYLLLPSCIMPAPAEGAAYMLML